MTDKIVSLAVNPVRMSGGAYYEDEGLISRVLLVRTGLLNILFDAGPGQSEQPDSRHVLAAELTRHGLTPEDITHVVLSHLHRGHGGGLLKGGHTRELLFPNARFIAGKDQVHRASHPHSLDQDLFIPGLASTLEKTNRLTLISEDSRMHLDGLTLDFIISRGHTPGMVITLLRMGEITVVTGSDLIPGQDWIDPASRMGYSRFPEKLTDEKVMILDRVVEEKALLFYSHGEVTASKIAFSGERYKPCELMESIDFQV